MRRLIYCVALLVAFIIESTIFVQYQPFGIVPDLLMIIVICGALIKGSRYGMELGLYAGVVQDLLIGNFGVSIIINVFIAYIVGTLENKIVKEQLLVPVIVTFFITIAHEILYLFLSEQLIFSIPILWALKMKIFPLAAVNALLIIPIYFCFFKLERKIY